MQYGGQSQLQLSLVSKFARFPSGAMYGHRHPRRSEAALDAPKHESLPVIHNRCEKRARAALAVTHIESAVPAKAMTDYREDQARTAAQ